MPVFAGGDLGSTSLPSNNRHLHESQTLRIVHDDLSGVEIAALLEAHLRFARASSPSCSVHALDLDRLKDRSITFWSAWHNDQLVGCIALKELSPEHGEIKSMHTVSNARQGGVGQKLLEHLLTVARHRGYQRISLETGSTAPFAPARRLYERSGFAECPPFADYVEDGFSMCMTREI